MNTSMSHKRFWFMKGVKIFLFMLVAGTLFTFAVMTLWNWLIPAIFNLGTITFWQALGIMLLSRILFGTWGGKRGRHGHGGHPWKHRMKGHWKNMSDEEREEFKSKMKKWCGPRKWDDDATDTPSSVVEERED